MYAHIFRSAVLVNFQKGGPDEGGHSARRETSKGNDRLESRRRGGYFLSSLERRAFENERQTQVADLWRLFEVCFPARPSPYDVKSQRRRAVITSDPHAIPRILFQLEGLVQLGFEDGRGTR